MNIPRKKKFQHRRSSGDFSHNIRDNPVLRTTRKKTLFQVLFRGRELTIMVGRALWCLRNSHSGVGQTFFLFHHICPGRGYQIKYRSESLLTYPVILRRRFFAIVDRLQTPTRSKSHTKSVAGEEKNTNILFFEFDGWGCVFVLSSDIMSGKGDYVRNGITLFIVRFVRVNVIYFRIISKTFGFHIFCQYSENWSRVAYVSAIKLILLHFINMKLWFW